MSKKQTATWIIFSQSVLIALSIYLFGLCLTALLLVKGLVSEDASFPVVLIFAVLSVLIGGFIAVRKSGWGTLPTGLAIAGLVASILMLVGLLCWGCLSLSGQGWILLLSIFLSGVITGLFGGRKKNHRKYR